MPIEDLETREALLLQSLAFHCEFTAAVLQLDAAAVRRVLADLAEWHGAPAAEIELPADEPDEV